MIPAPAKHTLLRAAATALLLAAAAPGRAQDSNGAGCAASEDCARERLEVEVVEAGAGLDWVPIEDVPPALRDRSCKLCGGRYIDPKAGLTGAGDPEESDIEATATRTELRGDQLRLEGGVEVTQGYRDLAGDRADYDRVSETGKVEGNIVLREPGLLLRGSRGAFYSRTGEAQLEDGVFVLHEKHLRGEAVLLSRDAASLIRIEDGALTYCAPGERDWYLRTRHMTLDLEEGVGVARGATLSAAGVPFFWTPWLSFPLDDRRRTGFLFPTVGNDSRGGIDVSTPFYWNAAPDYDLLYVPRYIQERGLNHEVQGRYLDPAGGNWLLGGAFLAGDEQYKEDFPADPNPDRWLGQLRHNGLYGQRWRSRIDYTRVSDVAYIRDLETSNLETRREVNLLQLASLDYLGDDWLVNMELQQFQSLADDIREDYKKLPQVTVQRRGDREPFRFEPLFLAQYSNFDSNGERVTGQRLYSEAGLSYPMLWEYGFLRSTAKYRYLDYRLNDPLAQDRNDPSAGSALASLDGGLYFERAFSVAGRDLVQTLEPRLYYLYSSFEDQRDHPDFDSAELTFNYNQLFRDTRFSGRDRLDDANQLAIGVTTRFLNRRTGTELLNASLGQIVYFDNRRVRLRPTAPELERTESEIAGELNFYPTQRLNLRATVQYDPSTEKVNAGNLFSSYEREDGALLNAGYTYRRPINLVGTQPTTDQAHLSAYYPVSRHWRLFGAWNYSLEADESVEDMVGIEYDNCCWKIRLLHLRYFDTARGIVPDFDAPNLDRERAVQVQFVLKGLGGLGTEVEQLMTDMIRGFRP
ncbi:LPS-assembly protein LptD [Pseudohaliea rubra]|uniref:LPS-assembly protein LptD n=1 Tax=Pseudohaliea rubra DSM 19751 TaxID=1265313 RepID=A0A095VN94_9GAMM|nr:LPS-assembly protein LptD [Pseudohaliea rubra]KGE02860.1 Outer membrane protein Imp [Pseudohaliea rubra DSM 19751]